MVSLIGKKMIFVHGSLIWSGDDTYSLFLGLLTRLYLIMVAFIGEIIPLHGILDVHDYVLFHGQ